MKHKIWLYWDNYPGRQKPPYLELCLATINKYCGDSFDIHLLSSDDVGEWLPDLRSDWHDMKQLNQRANYLRYKLLYTFGGIWLDSDIILLRSLLPLMQQAMDADEYDLIATGSPEYGYGEPENGFIVSRQGGTVITEALDIADQRLTASNTKQFQWGYLGVQVLREAVKKHPYHHLHASDIMPISWQNAGQFVSRVPMKYVVPDHSYAVMLFNEMFRRQSGALLTMPADDVMSSKMLIGQIFRKALS